jgi:hypothetical protein
MREVAFALAALLVAIVTSKSALAAGPSKDQCISANEDADALRKSGHLLAARTSLAACTVGSCPSVVRDDCNTHLKEVNDALPSVLITAVDGATPLTDVKVVIDNETTLAERLDGKPLEVDPGEHTFAFFVKGKATQTKKLTLKEGEKNHAEALQFGTPPPVIVDGHLVITSAPGASIAVDSLPVVVGRFDGPLAPGAHQVRVSMQGKIPVTRTVDLKNGESQSITVALENQKPNLLPWIIGGAAVVVAGLVVGGIVIASK